MCDYCLLLATSFSITPAELRARVANMTHQLRMSQGHATGVRACAPAMSAAGSVGLMLPPPPRPLLGHMQHGAASNLEPREHAQLW